jgi:hypothetical protein
VSNLEPIYQEECNNQRVSHLPALSRLLYEPLKEACKGKSNTLDRRKLWQSKQTRKTMKQQSKDS